MRTDNFLLGIIIQILGIFFLVVFPEFITKEFSEHYWLVGMILLLIGFLICILSLRSTKKEVFSSFSG